MIEMRPKRVFVFDNNGTGLDDLHVAFGSVEAIFAVLGLRSPNKDQYRNEIGADFMDFYWRHGVPRDITGEQLNVIRKLYYRMRQNTAHYRPDFEPLLRYCESVGAEVGMCSAEIPEVLQGFLERAKLTQYFDANLICGGAWPSKTPVLASMAQRLGLHPSECVYVDDTDDGIKAAQKAGFFAIGFTNATGYNSARRIHDAHPDLVVSSFTELKRVLPKLIEG
ncbi:MAG: HAD family hydrolase [Patescibacteria group bacterium]